MAWRDDLEKLRREAEEAFAERFGDVGDGEEPEGEDPERTGLYQLAATLQVGQLLIDLNEVVLGGTGLVQTSSHFDLHEVDDEYDDDDEDDDEALEDDDDFGEELVFSLSWLGALEYSIDVELVWEEGRIALLVNGEEVRQQRENLERAVILAFKEEMDF